MKLCGYKESCFKNGPQWGHFEGVMCIELGEVEEDGKCHSVCCKTDEKVRVYFKKSEYDNILTEGDKDSIKN